MAATLSLDNAVAWAQVRLRGGWKNLAVTGFAYAILIGGGIYSSAKLLAPSPSVAYGGWLPGLLGLQSAVLLLFGASRVGAAIRQDHVSRMIESHRMMPIGAGQAIVGYLVGSTSQAIVLAAVNLILGMAVAVGAGISVGTWLAANIILAAFCGFIWILSAFWAFLVKAPFALFLILGLGTWFSQGMLLILVPALTALVGPMIGSTVFSFRAATTEPNFAYAVSFGAQAVIGAICFIGAARRFRRGDAPAFTLPLSMSLLAAWVAVSWVTIWQWDQFKPRFVPGNFVSVESQLVGSLLASMLLALTPVVGSARSECEWDARVPDDPRRSRRPLPLSLVAAAATVLVVCLSAVELTNQINLADLAGPILRTAAVVFLFLAAAGYFLQVLLRCAIRPVVPMLIWLVLSWLGPLLGDVLRYNLLDNQNDPVLRTVSTCSPLGALLQIWTSGRWHYEPINTTLGIVAQAIAAGVFFLLNARIRKMSKRKKKHVATDR